MVKFITRTICMALVAVLCVGSANAQLVKTRTNAPEAAKLDAASMAKVVAKTTPAPKGMVNVTLAAGDVWGDGSGYQMLLDADATEFGVTIPATGALYANCSAPATLYNVFEYKIPENADPVCTTSNIVYNNEITIQIPAGTYDYCIANPSPGDKIWIAGGASNNGRKDNFVFEDGKKYKFTVTLVGTGDDVALLIEDDMPDNPCPLVTGLEIAPNGTEATMSWTAPAEGTPEGYEIYLDGTLETTVTVLTYTFTDLSAGTHTASVAAFYDDDCIPVKVTEEFTIAGSCNGPTNLEVEFNKEDCKSATLTWEAPAAKNGRSMLWDNTAGEAQTGYISVAFTGDANSRLVQADDFIVTGYGWIIEEIYSYGFHATSSATYPIPEYIGVAIYEDSGDGLTPKLPAIYENNALSAASGTNTAELNLVLPEPFTIDEPGKYWISVYGVHSGALSTSKLYYTSLSSVAKESPLCRWDPSGVYTDKPFLDWTSYPGDGSYPSCAFSISGQVLTNPDVPTYYIYRDGVQIGLPTEETFFVDTDIDKYTEYTYSVAVKCPSGGFSPAAVVDAGSCVEPCVTPTNLAFSCEGGTLTITWEGEGNFTIYKGEEVMAEGLESAPYVEENYGGNDAFGIVNVCEFEETMAFITVTPCEVGITNPALSSLRIYPNPASSVVTIAAGDVAKVEVYNVVGQMVDVKTGNITTIDVSTYNNGIYLFRVYDSNNNVATQRVMVSK